MPGALEGATSLVSRTGVGYSATAPTERWLLLENRLRRWDSSLPLVIYAPGTNQTIEETADDALTVEVARRGLPCLIADLGGPETFGNDTARDRVDDLIGWGRTNLAVSNKLMFVGVSGGFDDVGTCMKAHVDLADGFIDDVICQVGIIPGADLEDIRAFDRGGYASNIETAHGGLAAWTAARPTHNPVEYAIAFTKPTRIWYASGDPICLPARALAFAAAAGCEATQFTNAAHGQAGLDVTQVADWLHLQFWDAAQ